MKLNLHRLGTTGLGLLFTCLLQIRSWCQTPPNDLFANREVLTGPTASAGGTNVGATTEPGEPAFALKLDVARYWAGGSIWWTWTAVTNRTVYIDTVGSSFDTLLSVYTGDSLPSLWLAAADDDTGGNWTSRLSFYGQAGTNYQISVAGYLGATGSVTLRLWQEGFPPGSFGQPASSTNVEGSSVTLSTTHVTGLEPATYQWSKDGIPSQNATNFTLALTNLQPSDAGAYSVVLSNSLGLGISSNAYVSVVPILVKTQPQSMLVATGYSATLSVSANGPAPMSYQWRKDGVTLAGATNSSYTISSATLSNAGMYTVLVTDALTAVLSSNAVLGVLLPYTFKTLTGQANRAGGNNGPQGVATFQSPHGIAVDKRGYVYVADYGNSTIRRITPGGVATTIAGAAGSSGSADGLGSAARFNSPLGLAVEDDGTLFVADTLNNTIRKISPEGLVTTIAGTSGVSGYSNAVGAYARFSDPADVAADAAENLYIADDGNNTLRKIDVTGAVTAYAGPGTVAPGWANGPALKAGFWHPAGLSLDAAGNVYVADEYNNSIRKVSNDGWVTTLAGTSNGGSGDGTGSSARFYYPHGGKVDAGGNVYIADYMNCTIRRVSPAGVVTTLAGKASNSGSVDGTGNTARFSQVRGVAVDQWGNLYVADFDNHTIRKGWPADASTPPTITIQPQDQTLVAGRVLTLSVGAGGSGLFSYRWQLGGTPIPNQTNDVLVINPVGRANAGVYSVVVSNQFGWLSSSNALVRVLVPPVMQIPTLLADGTLRLQFQDSDGGLPEDLCRVAVQWRTDLPSGLDTNWLTIETGFYISNGFALFDETNALNAPSRFYRILKK